VGPRSLTETAIVCTGGYLGLGDKRILQSKTRCAKFHYMQIKVMPDYGCAPLWWDEPERVGNIAPEELGLTKPLTSDLWAWASEYDATLNAYDPTRSGFNSECAQRDFEYRGQRLAERVALELVDASVRYWRQL